jgi:hypothetical protein
MRQNFRPDMERLEDRTLPAVAGPMARAETADVHAALMHALEEQRTLPAPEVKQINGSEIFIDWKGTNEEFYKAGVATEEAETKVMVEFDMDARHLALNRSVSGRHVLIDVLARELAVDGQSPEAHVGHGSQKITVRIADAKFAEMFFTHEYSAQKSFEAEIVLPSEEEIHEALEAKEEANEEAAEFVYELAEMEHKRHQHAHDHEHVHPPHEHEHVHAHVHEHHHHEEEEEKPEEKEEHEGLTEEQLQMIKAASLVADQLMPKTPAEAAAKVITEEAKIQVLKEHQEHHGEGHHGAKEGHGAPQGHGGAHGKPEHKSEGHAAPKKEHEAPHKKDHEQSDDQEMDLQAQAIIEPAKEDAPRSRWGRLGAAAMAISAYLPWMKRRKKQIDGAGMPM